MFTHGAAPLNLSPLPSPSSLLLQPLPPSLGPHLPLSLPDPHAWASLDLGHLSPSRAHTLLACTVTDLTVGSCLFREADFLLLCSCPLISELHILLHGLGKQE